MHVYSVYGLGLHSEFPIPELLEHDSAAPDIVVRQATITVVHTADTARAEADAASETVPRRQDARIDTARRHAAPIDTVDLEEPDSWAERLGPDVTLAVFAGVGRYLVERGQTVSVEPEPGVDFALVRHLLLGPVLAYVLWQRDVFALHASVVGLMGHHVAFVGVSGEGKSTIAAALEAAGHVLVCDDVAALRKGEASFDVLPGFPRIRLHADSLRGIGDDPARHPFVHEQIDKRLKRVGSFARSPVALDAIYVLATGPQLAVERLAPGAAIMEILRNTYYAHQFAPLYGFPLHLERARVIAERVPAFRLTRPKDLARLPELIGFLEARVCA